MTLRIDRKIYPDSCISKVVYWLSDQYTIERRLEGDEELLSIDGEIDQDLLRKTILEKLNDYKLRGIIDAETKAGAPCSARGRYSIPQTF